MRLEGLRIEDNLLVMLFEESGKTMMSIELGIDEKDGENGDII